MVPVKRRLRVGPTTPRTFVLYRSCEAPLQASSGPCVAESAVFVVRMRSNPSMEPTSKSLLRRLSAAAHFERYGS